MNVYSDIDINILIKKLSDNIKSASKGDIFSTPTHRIIIPSLVNKNWITFELLKHLEIAVKFEFDTLEWSPYRLAKDIGVTNLPSTLTKKDLFFDIISILLDDKFLENDSMRLIKSYITDDDKKIKSIKTYQLGNKLVDLFVNYIENYSYIIDNWNRDIVDKNNIIEYAEYLIYKEVEKNTNANGRIIIKNFDLSSAKKNDNIKLHIFGYPYISQGTLKTVKDISEYIDTSLYLNPVSNSSVISKDWIKIERKFKENLKNMNIEYFDSDVKSENNVSNLLGALKNKPEKKIEQDTSLQIIGCPGVYREVECVYSSIIDNLEKNKNLKLEDIGVLLTDVDTYYPTLVSVFDREKSKLSYNVTCAKPRIVSDYISGIEKLFDLINGTFSRENLVEILSNKCFQKKFKINNSDVDDLISVADKLNIWGFFNKEHKDNYFNKKNLSSKYTWQQAGVNLRLGKVMNARNEDVWESYYSYSNKNADLNLFVILEKLYYECRYNEGISFNKPVDVIFRVKEFIDMFLDVDEANEGVKLLIDNSLDDFCHQVESRNYIPTLLDILEYLKMVGGDTNFSKGKAFTNGVIVGHIRNIRMSNFKILYILGLNEGSFPGKEERISLDLTRDLDDKITVIDEDKYIFYRLCKAVKDKLYLTYNSKDIAKDEDLFPSTCVSELIEYLNKNVLNSPFCSVMMPVFGRSLKYYKKNILLEREKSNKEIDLEEITDFIVNYNELDYELAKIDYNLTYNIEENIKYNADDNKENYFKSFSNAEDVTGISLNIVDIVKFLLNPVEYTLEKRLGLKSEFNDNKDYIHEPFSIKKYEINKIMKSAVYEYIATRKVNNSSIKDIIDRVCKPYEREDLIPDGVIGEKFKEYFRDDLSSLIEKFKLEDFDESKIIINYLIGENNKPYLEVDYSNRLDVLKVEDENKTYKISGVVPLIEKSADLNRLYLFNSNKKIKYELEIKLLLMLYAAVSGNTNCDANYLIGDKAGSNKYKLKNDITVDNIKEYFKGIAAEMQKIENLYDLLPYEIYSSDAAMKNKISELDNNAFTFLLTNKIKYNIDSDYSHYYPHYLIDNMPFNFSVPKDSKDKITDRFKKIDEIVEAKVERKI